jgi:Type I phosphodiesterase / nucleotide pyrophosphatase
VSARPLLAIGASGVSWELLDTQIEAGRMPSLAKIVRGGVSASLLSERVEGDRHFRPQVAWATLATGCSAKRHGVTRFYHEGGDLREKSLWEYWQESGLSVGVFGWPGTWPPGPTRGFIVPSHLARDEQAWPENLSQVKALDRLLQSSERDPTPWRYLRSGGTFLSVLARHRLPLTTAAGLAWTGARAAVAGRDERRLLLRRAKLDLMSSVFLALSRNYRPDCAAFVTFYVDFALHRFWRDWQPQLFGGKTGRGARRWAIPRAFQDLDRTIGRLVRARREGGVVAFVSEHGMVPEPESSEIGPVYYAIRGERVLDVIGLSGAVRTAAIARWIAYRPLTEHRLPADLASRLRRIVVVESGLPLFAVHEHGTDEVVVKLRLPRTVAAYSTHPLADLTVTFSGRVVPFAALTRPLGEQRSAMHSERAAFAIAGPGIRKGDRISDAHLVDVLPTLAAACGLPIPTGLDGRCLDVFA